MILAGTDELGYLLSKDAELRAWEAAHPARIDLLSGARWYRARSDRGGTGHRPGDGPARTPASCATIGR